MDRPSWAPAGIDLDRPSAARVYDYYLGGFHNFAADREMGRRAVQLWPQLPEIMKANRAFLRRAVDHLVGAGIRQFLDLGSGIPTVGNVHEIARQAAPDARVVYVDNDPVAVEHGTAILGGDPQTAVVDADLRQPASVLADPAARKLIDPLEPVAVLMVAVLHFVSDDADPAGIIAGYRARVPAGSYLVISHASTDDQPEELTRTHRELYQRTATPMTMRTRAQVTRFFDGFELLEPGVVHFPLWRPEPGTVVGEHPERLAGLVGVGRKP